MELNDFTTSAGDLEKLLLQQQTDKIASHFARFIESFGLKGAFKAEELLSKDSNHSKLDKKDLGLIYQASYPYVKGILLEDEFIVPLLRPIYANPLGLMRRFQAEDKFIAKGEILCNFDSFDEKYLGLWGLYNSLFDGRKKKYQTPNQACLYLTQLRSSIKKCLDPLTDHQYHTVLITVISETIESALGNFNLNGRVQNKKVQQMEQKPSPKQEDKPKMNELLGRLPAVENFPKPAPFTLDLSSQFGKIKAIKFEKSRASFFFSKEKFILSEQQEPVERDILLLPEPLLPFQQGLLLDYKNYRFGLERPWNKLLDDAEESHLIETIVGFLNEEGGRIILGVDQGTSKIAGYKLNNKDFDLINNYFNNIRIKKIDPIVTQYEVSIDPIQLLDFQPNEGSAPSDDFYLIKIAVKKASSEAIYCIESAMSLRRRVNNQNVLLTVDESLSFYEERIAADGKRSKKEVEAHNRKYFPEFN